MSDLEGVTILSGMELLAALTFQSLLDQGFDLELANDARKFLYDNWLRYQWERNAWPFPAVSTIN